MRTNPTTEPSADLTGKTIVITGASSGIGAAAAQELARRGATVIPVGRSPQKTEVIARELGVEPVVADFASFDSVRGLAARLLAEHPRIDVFAHNAGLLSAKKRMTADGHELTFQADYLAPFLLQHLLSERLTASGARVIVTSSAGHWGGRIRLDDLERTNSRYSSFRSYANSKLADLIFARELARRSAGTGLTAFAFHPGLVHSNFALAAEGWWSAAGTTITRPFMISSEAGARPLVRLATIADPQSVNGQYFSKGRAGAATSSQARDGALGHALWEKTEEILGL